MARTVTLLDLKTKARNRADMVGSNFVSDPELVDYINESLTDLYDLLVQNYGEDYFLAEDPFQFTVNSGQSTYDLPEDFYKLTGVDVLVGSRWVEIRKYNFHDRNRGQEGSRVKDVRYRLHGLTKIRFTPDPTGTHTARIWYIPTPPRLVEDEDTFDGIAGWEEYIVVDTAIKMLNKEETDVSVLIVERNRIRERIVQASSVRDAGEPEQIANLEYQDNEYIDYVFGAW